MAIQVNDKHDWEQLFGDVQRSADIPATRQVTRTGTQLTYRGMLVRLDDVIAAVQAQKDPPVVVFVYADVVMLPESRNWALDKLGLVVAARRIVATTGTFLQLDYRGDNNAKLVLYASEVEGPLQVRVFGAKAAAPAIQDLSAFPALGVTIERDGTGAARRDLDMIDDSLLQFAGDLWISLASNFLYASVLAGQDAGVAAGMLGWIRAATAQSVHARELYLQSAAFASQLTLAASDVQFVPYLSRTVYHDVAAAFEDAAAQYEAQYRVFMQDKASVAQWAASADLMKQSYQQTDNFQRTLLAQAIQNAQAAEDAVRQASIRFTIQKNTVEQLRPVFEAGIEIWKSDQTLQAVFSIFVAVVQFAGAIAAMAVGDEAAAPAAGAAAAGAAQAASAAGGAAGQAAKVAGSAKTAADAMKALAKALGALEKVFTFAQQIMAASQTLGSKDQVDNIDIPASNDIAAQAEWDVFRLHIDNLMKFPVDSGIGGAMAYQEALDDLAIYGKALAATRAAYLLSAQEVGRLQAQALMHDAMGKALDGYAARLQQEQQRDERMMFLLYLRQSEIKRWLYLAMVSYKQAFRYWALRDSSVTPSAFAPVIELRASLAQIVQDYSNALAAFNPAPQVLKDLSIDIDDPSVIASLQSKGEALIVVPLSSPAFAGLGRVRLNRVRAWLGGLPSTVPIHVEISTSGNYDDRLFGTTYRFTSAPVLRTFEYRGGFADEQGIIVDGAVSDEEQYAYFQPTPFTEWLVRIPSRLNPGLRLETIDRLRLSFAGQVIGHQPARALAQAAGPVSAEAVK